MKTKTSRLLALLLTLAMVLPMVVPAMPVSAAEETTVEEIPTETLPADPNQGTQEIPTIQQWNFSDETDLNDFDVYTSGQSQFVVSDGVMYANGTDSEQKAILKQDISVIKTVSVNLLPGESGNIYGGVYVGAKDAQDGQDQIEALAVLVKSDYTGWSDAGNRIDLIFGEFNNNWTQHEYVISETGNGNNLFSGGNKEPLNLKLAFSRDCVLATLSLVSNPSKYIQQIFTVSDPAKLQGKVGLRSLGSDTKYDRFMVNEDYIPESLISGLKLDGTDEKSYAKTLTTINEKPVTIEAWVKMEMPTDKRRQAIISNYTGSSLAANSTGTWGLYTDEDGDIWYTELCSGADYNHTERVEMWTGEWTHIAVVRGQGTLSLYANGELIISRAHETMGQDVVLDNYLNIGYCTVAAAGESSNSTKGEIGDIRLWSTERTQAQIQANMYRELTGTEEGLIQHWNFDSHDKGIISNTVEGGVDLGVVGHAQIGNEEIRRWDFSDETQLEDFTFYYAPDYASESYNYSFSIKDEKLSISGSINNSSTDVKAILNEKIDNITYMGADVTQGGTSTANVSMLFGIKSINSANANVYEGFQARMTRARTSAAKRPYSEVLFNKISNGTVTAVTGTNTNTTFFPGADEKRPFHIQLTFTGNKVDAFMYRLDDPTVTNGQTYTVADGELDGQIGLQLCRTSVSFDNYTIISKAPETVAPPVIEDTTLYDNQGHNFGTESKLWRLGKELTETPYTVEAWVKIPEGVADSATGYIVTNANRAPYISMQMIAGGDLRMSWGVEDEGLAIVDKNFDVATELRNGKWTHVAYTCDVANDTVVAYINGKVMQTWENAGLVDFDLPDPITPDNLFAIGALGAGSSSANDMIPSQPMLGWIADVRMWNKPLTETEVRQSMMTQYTQAREGLIVNLPLSEKVNDSFADLSGNGYDVKVTSAKMVLEDQTHEPGAYSMVVIPDQQILSHYYEQELYGLYQWIADNREKENIQIVMNVGDMADNCGNLDQWNRNKAAWELLPDDLPFIAAPGNHDYDTNSGWNKGYGVREQLTIMNQYFPTSLFESYPTDIGFFDENNCVNQWQAFAVNGNHYLVMALEYVPQDDVIAWANEVVEAHPNHQVIVVTHSYVGSYGELDVPKLWSDFLSKHENIIMAFSGHVWSTSVVRRTDKGINGNDVHNILMDAQFSDTGNNKVAMVGILRFNADGTLCDVSYLSTGKDQYEAGSNFTLSLPEPAVVAAKVNDTYYATVNEAIAEANGQIVEILQSTDEAITVNADVIIDLAGNTLSDVTVAEGYSLKLMDTVSGGSAAVAGSVEGITEVNSEIYWVTGENGVYTAKFCVAELLQQVSLKDDLAMNFVFKADKATTVKVTFDGNVTAYDLSTMSADENGKYTISVDLAAAQMTEDIQLQLVCGDAVLLEKAYSVRRYAEAILTGDYIDNTKNLVKAMLNYGAKAQQYFDVNEDNLANAGYELDETTLPTEYEEMAVSGSVDGLKFYGASLVFKNKIAVRFYFTGSVEGVSFGDYEAVQKGDMYYVEVSGINPQDYSNSIALTATKGEETLTVSYSPLNYIIRMSGRDSTSAELKALVNALYGYHAAAVQYVSE